MSNSDRPTEPLKEYQLNSMIPFDRATSCTFCGRVFMVAAKQFGDPQLNIHELEAMRRACAVIEAVVLNVKAREAAP